MARAKWPGVVPGPSRVLCREGVAWWDKEVLRVNDGCEQDGAGRFDAVTRHFRDTEASQSHGPGLWLESKRSLSICRGEKGEVGLGKEASVLKRRGPKKFL